jgi:hypothetical protein
MRRVQPHNNTARHGHKPNDLTADLSLSDDANTATDKKSIECRAVAAHQTHAYERLRTLNWGGLSGAGKCGLSSPKMPRAKRRTMVTSWQAALVMSKMATARDRSPGFINPCSFLALSRSRPSSATCTGRRSLRMPHAQRVASIQPLCARRHTRPAEAQFRAQWRNGLREHSGRRWRLSILPD